MEKTKYTYKDIKSIEVKDDDLVELTFKDGNKATLSYEELLSIQILLKDKQNTTIN